MSNTYTSVVKFLRIALPTLAIISFAVLVVWTILNQEIVPEEDMSQKQVTPKPEGVEEDALQMTNPSFTGVDKDNRP